MDLRSWLERHEEEIARRWVAELRIRSGRPEGDAERVLEGLLQGYARLLPHCVGWGDEVGEEVWLQASVLYGSVALRRGLAAGEVVEELSLLREIIFRLYLEGEGSSERGIPLARDLLALNRIVDLGVVRASVAYLDDLFFAHLQGSGVTEGVTPELAQEIERQLQSFRETLAAGGE